MSSPKTLKVTLGSITRRFPLPVPFTFLSLQHTLQTHFNPPDPFLITYRDVDNDIITVSSDIELVEIYSSTNTSTLRLHLYSPADLQRLTQQRNPNTTDDSPLTHNQLLCLDALFTAVMELVAMICTVGAKANDANPIERLEPMLPKHNSEGEDSGVDSLTESSMVDTYHVNFPFQGGMHSLREPCSEWLATEMMMAKKGVFGVSEETKNEFRKLVCSIYASKERRIVIEAMKGVVGKAWKWVNECLDDQGLPQSDIVEELVEDVRRNVHDVEGGEEVCSFLKAMLRDETVVGFLRRVRDAGGMSKDRLCGKMARFDIHYGVVCVSCDAKPIVGSRFVNVSRQNFNMCADCYYKSDVAQNEMQFRECRYVWESTLPGFCVPPAELAVGDRGPRVKFLHKILLDVGAMTQEIYPGKMGCFGENTRAAVRNFQREQGLEGRCRDGIYDLVTAERMENIIEGKEVQNVGPMKSQSSIGECTDMSD